MCLLSLLLEWCLCVPNILYMYIYQYLPVSLRLFLTSPQILPRPSPASFDVSLWRWSPLPPPEGPLGALRCQGCHGSQGFHAMGPQTMVPVDFMENPHRKWAWSRGPPRWLRKAPYLLVRSCWCSTWSWGQHHLPMTHELPGLIMWVKQQ